MSIGLLLLIVLLVVALGGGAYRLGGPLYAVPGVGLVLLILVILLLTGRL